MGFSQKRIRPILARELDVSVYSVCMMIEVFIADMRQFVVEEVDAYIRLGVLGCIGR